MIVAPDLDAMAIMLRADPRYRVLRRFVPRERYTDPAAGAERRMHQRDELKTGLYVDCETTGLDTATDRIIELALVAFEFDLAGHVYSVGEGFNFLNDPGIPIRPEVTALTGISDADVKGFAIDELLVHHALEDAVLVVAHNADFDRKMLERWCPRFATTPWACSYREVEWDRFGCVGGKLQHILEGACGEFYEAHRALDDAQVGVHVLAAAKYEGRTALSYLLESARQLTKRVWAVNAPYSVKGLLKQRGYRWCDGTTWGRKAWYRDLRPDETGAECAWLDANAYVDYPVIDTFGALDRYSVRAGA